MGFTDYRLIGCISYVYPTVYALEYVPYAEPVRRSPLKAGRRRSPQPTPHLTHIALVQLLRTPRLAESLSLHRQLNAQLS